MPTSLLGQPCWSREAVAEAITSIAKVDVSQTHYFLASHAPVKHVRDDRTEEVLTEEDIFQTFLKNSRGEVLALVHGDPGTGKSHLIHWLKLRCGSALKTGELKKLVPVLIQRRTGSLKDALEQMIHQLGDEFAVYLTPVREALSKLSDTTAREKLAAEIGLELGPRRVDRGRAPLPRDLRNLRETCTSTGFRRWLCREGGVIDLNIKRLTQSSEVTEKESFPQFASLDFLITDATYRPDNTPDVFGLIDDFAEEKELRQQAAVFFNEALRDAIKEMTGLAGTTLRDIFDHIRAELKIKGKNLALFIEDVSVMSALDEEVFNAVEPVPRGDLCRMIAVLGITDEGWRNLWTNQKERVTYSVGVGKSASGEWRNDADAIAQFTARYLNTTRLNEDEVKQVAAHRQKEKGSDVHISACDKCPAREQGCHEIFGAVDIGNVQIGTFPFSVQAPLDLLSNLKESLATQKTPRGLLTQILKPVLEDGFDDLQSKRFPRSQLLAVAMPELSYWSGFEQKYCGGWNTQDKNRLKFLAQAWLTAETADDAAIQLKPLLQPLGFGSYSRDVSKRTTAVKSTSQPSTTAPSEPDNPPVQPSANPKLNKALSSLQSWIEGGELFPDKEPRELLAALVRKSVPWDDKKHPPLEVWKSLVGDVATAKYQFIRIEGQRLTPVASNFFIDFGRNEETRSLLEALFQFEYAGKGSWDFDHGELHKRTVARWLRMNHARIAAQLQPKEELATETPIKCAVQFLATATIVRQRKRLQVEDPVELVRDILSGSWQEQPVAINKDFKQLIEDLRLKHSEIKQFLVSELNVPQGRGLSKKFFDPLPLVRFATEFLGNVSIHLPTEDYYKDYWSSRYSIFERMSRYSDLLPTLERERDAIGDLLDTIRMILNAADYDTQALPETLQNYCTDLADVIKAQKATGQHLPDTKFDVLRNSNIFTERKAVWATAVKQAQVLVSNDDPLQVLLFDSKALIEARDSLVIASDYLTRLEKLIDDQLKHIEQEGDPDLLTASMLSELESIINMPVSRK